MSRLKIITGFLLFAAMFFMTSCKKDYTCECTKTYTGDETSVTTNYSTHTYKDTRLKAEERCNDNEKTDSDLLGNYTINCSID